MEKEENALVLDYLPYGYPMDNKMNPLAQALGTKNFTLLQLIPRRGMKLEVGETVYIGEGKRDKIYFIQGKIQENRLTETTKKNLEEFIGKYVLENEKRFIEFFNSAEAINTRLHQLELLPGFGKKHTEAIIEARNKNSFESFEGLKKRVANVPDPKSAIVKRIIEEIIGKERYILFLGK